MRAIAAVLALPLSACASTPTLVLAPPVQSTELRNDAGTTEARVLVAWRGVHAVEGGIELRFRVRVENPLELPFTLVPAHFELLDGALASLGGDPIAEVPVSVAAGSSAAFDVAFPLASAKALDAFDLASLTLRADLQAGHWNWSTTFVRAELVPLYADPYWGPTWHFGVVWRSG